MNDSRMKVSDFELRTTDSYISLQADAGFSIGRLIDGQIPVGNDGRISARLMADIGKNDIFRFVAGMPEDFPSSPLQLRAGIDGSLDALKVTAVSAEIPGHIRFIADGYADDITDSTKMCARINMKACFPDMKFARSFLGTTVIPPDMTLSGTAVLRNDSIMSFMKLMQGEGTMELKAGFIPEHETYFARIDVNDINIHNFMPEDSLFRVSASVEAKGKGFDFMSPECEMDVNLNVSGLEYAKYILSGINMNAGLKNNNINTLISINDSLAEASVRLNADISAEKIAANMIADIKRLDLYAMGVSAQPLKVAQTINIDADTDLNRRHSAGIKIDNIKLMTPEKTFATKDLNLGVSMTEDSLRSYINSGDMTVLLRTTGGMDLISERFTKIADMAEKQWKSREMNLDTIRRMLPETTFRIFAGDGVARKLGACLFLIGCLVFLNAEIVIDNSC